MGHVSGDETGREIAAPGDTVLLTGATGFIGRSVYPHLVNAGYRVRCGARRLEAARGAHPDRDWVRLDLDEPDTLGPALDGCRAALFLVHRMSDRADYEERERSDALAFSEASERAGLGRIVYLGGMLPAGTASRHLRSRSVCGEALRQSQVSVVELRAAMVIGSGSESWRIVRDLSSRLPVMLLPAWLDSRSQPIAIEDVCFALTRALSLPPDCAGAHDLPGPETISAREILERVSRLIGHDPWTVRIPVVTPKLSSYWIQLVTRANPRLARELVDGLREDLTAPDDGFWKLVPEHARIPFDEAARRALAEEQGSLSPATQRAEAWLQRFRRRS